MYYLVLVHVTVVVVNCYLNFNLAYSSGALTPDDLEAEYGDDLDFLILKLKCAHKDPEVCRQLPYPVSCQ